MASFIETLCKQIEEIELIFDKMLDNSLIFYHDHNRGAGYAMVIGAPVYHYSKVDERGQILILEKYSKLRASFDMLLAKATPQTLNTIQDNTKRIEGMIAQDRHYVPKDVPFGKLFLRQHFTPFKQFLSLFKTQDTQTIVVPDTNSNIQYPDPIDYKKLKAGKFSFVILPTVLSELDKHKVAHRDSAFRDKVKTGIKRLKGYRTQGNVLEGVIVDKVITVKMVATEPDFKNTLYWLDPENADDRIIASVLALQLAHPSDQVIFVTSDINLQNKAQMANLTFYDTDELEVQ